MAAEGLPESVQRLCAGAKDEAYLAAHHAEAARRLVRLFERAALRQRVTMSYDPGRVGSGKGGGAKAEIADSAADARRRLALLAADLPPDCWGVLTDICAFDQGLQQIEAARGWPRRSAKLVLRIGLEQLARRDGLTPLGAGPDHGRNRHWRPERLPLIAERAVE